MVKSITEEAFTRLHNVLKYVLHHPENPQTDLQPQQFQNSSLLALRIYLREATPTPMW